MSLVEEKPRVRVQAGSSRVQDSVANFSARIGLGTGNLQDATFYSVNPISRNRLQLEWAYRGSWIVRQLVDAPAEDATRAGTEFHGETPPEDIDDLVRAEQGLQIWHSMRQVIKWARLYGGAIGWLLIDGQSPEEPLRIDTIKQDQFKGIMPLDRWMIQPSLTERVTDIGPDYGMPAYYTIVSAQGMPRQRIHHTRVVRLEGVDIPYYQRQGENGWGISVCEPMWDRLIAFDSGTMGAAQLLHKAYLRTLKFEGFRDAVATTGRAAGAIANNIDWIRLYQSAEGMTVLDAKDTFETHQYNFGGISDVLIQLAQQIAGATQIPLVRLFGQSPIGMNATGESDIRFYYDSILAYQEARLRRPFGVIYDLMHRSVLGREPDDGFHFTFRALWQMSAVERSNIAASQAATISSIDATGAIDNATILKELKQASVTTGMWSNITDEMIVEAENAPPEPMETDPSGLSNPLEEEQSEEAGVPTATPKDAAYRHSAPKDYDPSEGRDPDGKWTSGGGGGSAAPASSPVTKAKMKVAAWLNRENIGKTLDSVVKDVKTSVRDKEKVKAAIGNAVNLAIGHYVYTHDYVDSDIVAHAISHVEIGLAISASQAKDVLRATVNVLIGAHRGTRDADEEDEILEALLALQKELAGTKDDFDPSEPRDPEGKWTSGGEGGFTKKGEHFGGFGSGIVPDTGGKDDAPTPNPLHDRSSEFIVGQKGSKKVITDKGEDTHDGIVYRNEVTEVPVKELRAWQNIVYKTSKFKPLDESYPPIKVVKLKGQYIVRDGNHRAVSAYVAGQSSIKAHVLDLDNPKNAKLFKAQNVPAGFGESPPPAKVRDSFDPSEPREPDGEWTSGGGSSSVAKSNATASHSPAKKEGGKHVAENGGPLPPHIQALKIPPAWTGVTYSNDPNAALQATGKDSKGRRQAVYSEAHSAKQAEAKFMRINELHGKFEEIYQQNQEARKSSNPKTVAAADVTQLIMHTGIRPGSDDDTGASVKAYGATTLEGRHVSNAEGKVTLNFIGKKGVALNIPVEHDETARMLLQRKEKAGDTGQLFEVNEKTVLDHVHSLGGGGFKTKDFRTLKGTRTAMAEVEKAPAPKSAAEYKKAVMTVAKTVSNKLGNTPVIALQSYINPSVFAHWRAASAN